MAITLTTRTEIHEASLIGQHSISNRYFNVNKTVEKFINTIPKPKDGEVINPSSYLNDPTITGFKVFFHFSAEEGLLAEEIYENSALKFLKDIGDDYRYNLLIRFRNLLSDVNSNHAWIFNNIEGLREIFTNPFTSSISYYSKSNKIVLGCFETIDYKISALNHLWREIYWDMNRGVMVLPENLRQFGMSVYLMDMRVFNTNHSFLRNSDTKSFADINHQLFDITNCQFLIESGGAFFDVTSNMSIQESLNNFVIGYDIASISYNFANLIGDTTYDIQASQTNNEFVKSILLNKVSNNKTFGAFTRNDELTEINNDPQKKSNTLAYLEHKTNVLSRSGGNDNVSRYLSNQSNSIISNDDLFFGNLGGFTVQPTL